MNSDFIPFFQAFAPSQQACRADDASTRTAAASSQFVPSVIPGAPSAGPQPDRERAGKHAPHGQPEITLEKDGERITHIRIRCTCGQVTEIECAY